MCTILDILARADRLQKALKGKRSGPGSSDEVLVRAECVSHLSKAAISYYVHSYVNTKLLLNGVTINTYR